MNIKLLLNSLIVIIAMYLIINKIQTGYVIEMNECFHTCQERTLFPSPNSGIETVGEANFKSSVLDTTKHFKKGEDYDALFGLDSNATQKNLIAPRDDEWNYRDEKVMNGANIGNNIVSFGTMDDFSYLDTEPMKCQSRNGFVGGGGELRFNRSI